MIPNKTPAALTALLLVIAMLAGCVDSDARRRDEVQQTINQAASDFDAALATGFDPANDQARAKLLSIAKALTDIDAGAPGQRAAAALLLSDTYEALGLIETRRAEQLEAVHAIDRIVLHSAIDAAGQLEAIAQGRDQISQDQRLTQLDQARLTAVAGLETASQTAASLDDPIAKLTKENEVDSDEVAQLRMQANAMYRRAGELGRVAGLSSFQDATKVRREAELIERRMASRENELGYRYQPASDMAMRQVDSLKSLIEQIDQARADLQAAGASAVQQTAAIRTTVAQFKQAITQVLNDLNSRGTGDLAAAYDSAISSFEKAATQGEKAASAGIGRLASARAYQSLGDLLSARARSQGDHVILLQRLIDAGDALANASQLAEELQAAELARNTAAEQAQAAYTGAIESLAQVSSRDHQALVDAMKFGIETALAMLTGAPPPSQPAPAARGSDDSADGENASQPPASVPPASRGTRPQPAGKTPASQPKQPVPPDEDEE